MENKANENDIINLVRVKIKASDNQLIKVISAIELMNQPTSDDLKDGKKQLELYKNDTEIMKLINYVKFNTTLQLKEQVKAIIEQCSKCDDKVPNIEEMKEPIEQGDEFIQSEMSLKEEKELKNKHNNFSIREDCVDDITILHKGKPLCQISVPEQSCQWNLIK